jgi:tRNA-binding EMAP/Myf-like protein
MYNIMPDWTCTSCEYDANEESSSACESCGDAAPATTSPTTTSTSPLIVVACIISLEPVPKKDKLRIACVDAGPAANGLISIVTNAPNVAVGSLVVVALPGARVRNGTEEILVSTATVGGMKSSGMLCDAPMLGWVGGGKDTAALVPDTFKPGDAPPTVRPRVK